MLIMRPTLHVLMISLGFAAAVKAEEFTFTPPSADRWHYGFNSSPGVEDLGRTFMAPGWAGINGQFNDRDGYVIFAWDTSGSIAPGQDPESYNVTAVELTVTNIAGAEWLSDASIDEWFTYDLNGDGAINADGFPRGHPSDTDGESSDSDPGRTIDIYGVGFGPHFTAASWTETSAYRGALPAGPPFNGDPLAPRDPFPFVYQAGSLDQLHVEDHIRGLHNDTLPSPVLEFSPQPWAIGQPLDYAPGNQTVPFDIRFTVNLALSGGEVRRYFQEGLAEGTVFLIVSSAQETEMQGGQEEYPTIFMRDAVGSLPGAKAAALSIEVTALPGDYDGDGDVDHDDFVEFPPCLTGPTETNLDPTCAAFDFDADADIDLSDYAGFQEALPN
jgi:hypothetical protein